MSNMYSIGELIDKLIIENIKIFTIREKNNTQNLDNEEYLSNNNKMFDLNENRSIIIKFLNDKIEDVKKGEPNAFFKNTRTYK